MTMPHRFPESIFFCFIVGCDAIADAATVVTAVATVPVKSCRRDIRLSAILLLLNSEVIREI